MSKPFQPHPKLWPTDAASLSSMQEELENILHDNPTLDPMLREGINGCIRTLSLILLIDKLNPENH
jgi:hypothetical protein